MPNSLDAVIITLVEICDLFEQKKAKCRRQVVSSLKRLKRAISKENAKIAECQQADHIFHTAQLLQAHFSLIHRGLKSITLLDWDQEGKEVEIALNPLLAPQEQVAHFFKKAKKLKKGQPFHQERLEVLKGELAGTEQKLLELDEIKDSEALDVWIGEKGVKTQERRQEAAAERKKRPYHRYQSQSGDEIWVGKCAKDNEVLTFSLGRGNDWWFHAANVAGSHVLLRPKKREEIDPESFQDALLLAWKHSRSKGTEGEVVVTQCKYVKRFGKKQAGKVHLSRVKSYRVRFDPSRYERLREEYKKFRDI